MELHAVKAKSNKQTKKIQDIWRFLEKKIY